MTHQVPQCGLRLADNVIVTVVVLIKDCEPDGQGVVIVTKLGHGNIDQLPTWVQIVLNRLSLAYLKSNNRENNRNQLDMYTFLKSYAPLEAGLLRTRYGSLLVQKSQSAKFFPSKRILTIA